METKTAINPARSSADRYKDIPGWGMDADPENDPTYPIKHYTGADHNRLKYAKAPQQRQQVEILHSNERPGISRVFGTSVPPSGLSGMLRRYAFRFSEGSSGHWMTLILADRVNVVEGIVDDLRHGHIPNLFAEKGWNAEWKYNRKGMLTRAVVGIGLTAALFLLVSARSKRRIQGFN